MGIKETKDVLHLVVSLANAIQAASADGKIDLNDLPILVSLFGPLQEAIKDAKNIPAELGDLDEAEVQELTTEFGEIVTNPALVQAFKGAALLVDGLADFIKARQGSDEIADDNA